MEVLFTPHGVVSLITLTIMEIVLGIDNIIFISIIADKLPKNKQNMARTVGMILALVARVGLLFGLTWIIGLSSSLFNINELLTSIGIDLHLGQQAIEHLGISGKDLILIAGGMFLLAKSTSEIHAKITHEEEEPQTPKGGSSLVWMAIFQILMIDIVFSFDSILTAVGLVREITIMIAAVIISMIFMISFIKKVSDFINQNPTLKILALAFLIMIGFLLVAEGFEQHISKGYVYFSMAFAFGVEVLNMRTRKKKKLKHIEELS